MTILKRPALRKCVVIMTCLTASIAITVPLLLWCSFVRGQRAAEQDVAAGVVRVCRENAEDRGAKSVAIHWLVDPRLGLLIQHEETSTNILSKKWREGYLATLDTVAGRQEHLHEVLECLPLSAWRTAIGDANGRVAADGLLTGAGKLRVIESGERLNIGMRNEQMLTIDAVGTCRIVDVAEAADYVWISCCDRVALVFDRSGYCVCTALVASN